MSKIDEVVLAISDASDSDYNRFYLDKLAIAAIKAMKELTEEMVKLQRLIVISLLSMRSYQLKKNIISM